MAKAVQVPPRPIAEEQEARSPDRGELRFRITGEDKVEALLRLVAELFCKRGPARSVVLPLEDQVADVADFLALHGYMAGSPGDDSLPLMADRGTATGP